MININTHTNNCKNQKEATDFDVLEHRRAQEFDLLRDCERLRLSDTAAHELHATRFAFKLNKSN